MTARERREVLGSALWKTFTRFTLVVGCALQALALPTFPGPVMSTLAHRSSRPDAIEFPVHSDCGSYLHDSGDWLVTCSEVHGRVQLYSRAAGFVGGWFTGEPDPFRVLPLAEGSLQVQGGRASVPFEIDLSRWLPGERGGDGRASWHPVVLEESFTRIAATRQDDNSMAIEFRKHGLLSRSFSPGIGTLLLLTGAALVALSRRMARRTQTPPSGVPTSSPGPKSRQ